LLYLGVLDFEERIRITKKSNEFKNGLEIQITIIVDKPNRETIHTIHIRK
jgi:hypothetical protein